MSATDFATFSEAVEVSFAKYGSQQNGDAGVAYGLTVFVLGFDGQIYPHGCTFCHQDAPAYDLPVLAEQMRRWHAEMLQDGSIGFARQAQVSGITLTGDPIQDQVQLALAR